MNSTRQAAANIAAVILLSNGLCLKSSQDNRLRLNNSQGNKLHRNSSQGNRPRLNNRGRHKGHPKANNILPAVVNTAAEDIVLLCS